MKRFLILFVLFSVLCSPASAHASVESSYLWDVPIGIPVSDASARFGEIIGKPLKAKKDSGYYLEDTLIVGLSFHFIVGSDDSGNFDRLILRNSSKINAPLSSALSSDPVVFQQYNSLLNMLTEKLGEPVLAYWSFGKDYPVFDAPLLDSSFDFDTIISAQSGIVNSVSVYWDHVCLDIGVSSYETGMTYIGCAISESNAPVPNVETSGAYSRESLLLNSGITSF